MIKYKCEYEWFQIIYLKTDLEQHPWMLTSILLTPIGPMFTAARDGEQIDLYEGEFTVEQNTEMRLGI
jgi:hypothetical protein